MAPPPKQKTPYQMISENRKARFHYEILEIFEAGLQLMGTEVKSLRVGKVNLAEAHAEGYQGELWIHNVNISEYVQANRFNHEAKRPRKLLLHKRQINKLIGATQKDGLTIVPLKMYFNEKGRAKIEIALARGKKLHDKRETERQRDWSRQKSRLMKGAY